MTIDIEERLRADLSRLAEVLLESDPDAEVLAPDRGVTSARSPRARVLVGAGAVALVVALTLGGVALVSRGSSSVSTGASRAGSVAVDGPRPWPSATDPPPLSPRRSPGVALIGNQLFVWSGLVDGIAVGDGSAYHLSRDVWETTPRGGPSGPIMATSTDCMRTVATVAEAQACPVVGDPALVALIKNSGARYDPATQQWSELPRIGDGSSVFGAVTSLRGELYALVSTVRDGRLELAIATIGTDGQWHVGPSTRRGVLDSRGARSRHRDLTVDRGSLALWSDGVRVARYDVDGRSWHDADGLSLPKGFDTPQVVGHGDRIFAIDRAGEHAAVAYDARSDGWVRLPGGREVIGAGGSAVSIGDGVIVWDGRDRLWSWTIQR